jgi:hypothetical protein
MSDSGTVWLLLRCDHCGAVQALPREGGDLLDCCAKQNRYDASLCYAEQTESWRVSTEVVGPKPDGYEGLHLEWKQYTDGYWLMLGNKRLAEVPGVALAQRAAELNEILASIPVTQIKEKV